MSSDQTKLAQSHPAGETGPHECQNCGQEAMGNGIIPLAEVPDLGQRLSPGEIVPSGACLLCGALTHRKETEKRIWIVHNDGVELDVVRGPYGDDPDDEELVNALRDGEYFGEDDTLALLVIEKGCAPRFDTYQGDTMKELIEEASKPVCKPKKEKDPN